MYQYNDYELLYLICENDDTALDIMYRKYIPLIKARIKSFQIKRWNREDFLQEGLLVLFKAIQTYRPDSKKTFTKYFDLILQRRFIQILRKESNNFYNVDLVGSGDLLMENKISNSLSNNEDIIEMCNFSKFETQVLNFIKQGYKPREVSKALECSIKQVYDANDRIKKKIKGVKNSLDKKGLIC